MAELQIYRCRRCATPVYPARLRCPHCGAWSFEPVPAGLGHVEEATVVRRPPPPAGGTVRLGSVRLAAGPVVIARLSEDASTGALTRLEEHRDGAVWARQVGD